MRALLVGCAAVVAGVLVALGSAGPAGADPYHDIYHPDYMRAWCPGSGAGIGSGWCAGAKYPDGSFWHQAGKHVFGTLRIDTTCRIDTGGFLLELAGPGGCGGEV